MMDGLFKIIDNGILEKEELKSLIKELLNNINEDKDGSYFICAENKDIIDKLRGLLNV